MSPNGTNGADVASSSKRNSAFKGHPSGNDNGIEIITTHFLDQIAYKYSKEVEEIKDCNYHLERRIEELEHELQHAIHERDRHCEENHCLRKENEAFCNRISKLHDEVRALHLQISSLKATIAGLEKRKLSLHKKVEILVKELEIHKKELSIIADQLATCQTNLADSQDRWLLAVREQQKLELKIREKAQSLVQAEAERDGLDGKMKLVEHELELALERVEIGQSTIADWECRFDSKSDEITKLLEMWACMDKECKISVHGHGHWDLHHGFPKGLPHHRHPEGDEEVTVPPQPPPEDPKKKGKEPQLPKMPAKVPGVVQVTKKEAGPSIPVPSGKTAAPKS